MPVSTPQPIKEGIEEKAKAIRPRIYKNYQNGKLMDVGRGESVLGRVSDSDPHESALIWFDGSGSRRTKMTHKNRKERDG
jgi:hypothetical protein